MRPLLILFLMVGCGGGPRASVMSAVEARDVPGSLEAYDRFRAQEGGGDPELLAAVAALVLEQAVLEGSAEERTAALHQLEMSGTAGGPVLERLAERADTPAVRARALGVLAARGDGDAQGKLRAMLDSDDDAVLAEAVRTLDPRDETTQLVTLLKHTGGDVRAAAAKALRGAASSGPAYAALAEAARVDPLPKVRAAAVRSLGAYGALGFEQLRERLSDADHTVRMAAVAALVEADRARALSVIGTLLEMSPGPAAVEAARVLATGEGEGAQTARAFLRRALVSGEPNVRAQAAVALSSLPANDELVPVLLEALEREQDATVRRAVAGILIERPSTRDKAIEVLRAMMDEEGHAMNRVQAAALLARTGAMPEAKRALAEFMREGEPDIRRTAARALARDALEPDAARTALRDEDALVRIHAAGGILAAASAMD